MDNFLKKLLAIRSNLASHIIRYLISRDVSIVSDDCWGGQYYKQANIHYLTPTVGLWVDPKHYLDYIENFEELHKKPTFSEQTYDKNYPVGSLSETVDIYFMHYQTFDQAIETYLRRYKRVNHNKLFFKIDFGKPGYTVKDIDRWNSIALKNAVALYPPSITVPKEGVHNGILVENWVLDGKELFDISHSYFNIYKWAKTGQIVNSFTYQILNFLFFDQKVINKLRKNYQNIFNR